MNPFWNSKLKVILDSISLTSVLQGFHVKKGRLNYVLMVNNAKEDLLISYKDSVLLELIKIELETHFVKTALMDLFVHFLECNNLYHVLQALVVELKDLLNLMKNAHQDNIAELDEKEDIPSKMVCWLEWMIYVLQELSVKEAFLLD